MPGGLGLGACQGPHKDLAGDSGAPFPDPPDSSMHVTGINTQKDPQLVLEGKGGGGQQGVVVPDTDLSIWEVEAGESLCSRSLSVASSRTAWGTCYLRPYLWKNKDPTPSVGLVSL